MKFGLMVGADRIAASVKAICELAGTAEKAGFDGLWMAHIRSLDAISALSAAGAVTERIELGTAVTPIQPRHPMALAQQAMTASQICGGRFTLGIGLSHKIVIEDMLGLSYERPAAYMREYLDSLLVLIEGKEINFQGEFFKIRNLKLEIPEVDQISVVVAALGPKMLKIAGTLADGTSTWMTGPEALEKHVVKGIKDAASNSGRPSPRIIAGFPIVLTNRPQEAREKLEKGLAFYGTLPSYRAMLDKEGVNSPVDLALIGDEQKLLEKIEAIRSSGVTDFNAAIMNTDEGAFQRTFDFLNSLISI